MIGQNDLTGLFQLHLFYDSVKKGSEREGKLFCLCQIKREPLNLSVLVEGLKPSIYIYL